MNNQFQKEFPQFTLLNILNLQIYIEKCQQLEKQQNFNESLKYSSLPTLNQIEDSYYQDIYESFSYTSNESNTADYENDRQRLIIIKMYEIMQNFKQSNQKCVKRCNRKISNIDTILAKRS